MSKPSNKQEFADWILRKLGAPVINIEITNEQLEDVIDEAVSYYQDNHYEGTQRSYRLIKIDTDMLNGNHRNHQDITAPYYKQGNEYRIGSRVRATVDSNQGERIWIKYDSEEQNNIHKFYEYPFGDWFLENGTSEYVIYDSDTAMVFYYDSDTLGNWTETNGTYVKYDSDTHTIVHWDSEGIPEASEQTLGYWRLNPAVATTQYIPITHDSEIWDYASSTFTHKTIDSDSETYLMVGTNIYNIRRKVKSKYVFTGDSDKTNRIIDSDGFGTVFPPYAELKGYQVHFDFGIKETTIKVVKVDPTFRTGNLTNPIPFGFFKFDSYDSDKVKSIALRLAALDSDTREINLARAAATARTMFQNDSDSEVRRWTTRYNADNAALTLLVNTDIIATLDEQLNATGFYSRSLKDPTMRIYARRTTPPDRYVRYRYLNGKRYMRIEETAQRVYEWKDLWALEQAVLSEPELDLDYSITGQVGIPIPEDIQSVVKVFRVSSMGSSFAMLNVFDFNSLMNHAHWINPAGGYQWGMVTDLHIMNSYLELIDQELNLQPAIRYHKHKNRLYIDTYWKRINTSGIVYLAAEVYEITDPDVFGNVYKDIWLRRYATALAKMQWGSNLKKYSGTELPGGIQINGQEIYNEGKEEKQELEDKIANSLVEMDSILLG